MSPVWIFILAAFCSAYTQGYKLREKRSSSLRRYRRSHSSKRPVYFTHREEYDDFTFGSDEESEKEEEAHDFSYERTDRNRGPLSWGKYWHECQGRHQSPINLRLENSVFSLFKMRFTDESQKFKGVFVNNGHAPTFQLIDKGCILTGVPGRPYDKFVLIQFHFHFGMTSDHGSEHAMNGKYYAAEMHMVHYNTKYKSFDEAANKPDGLAVIAIFLDETYKQLDDFDKFVETYGKHIMNPTLHGIHTEFNPFTIFPRYRFAFSYQGSLTTPACYESVIWIVMRESVPIHHNTLVTLRKLKTKNPKHTIAQYSNDRPIQALHKRVILRNFTLRLYNALHRIRG